VPTLPEIKVVEKVLVWESARASIQESRALELDQASIRELDWWKLLKKSLSCPAVARVGQSSLCRVVNFHPTGNKEGRG
jgi:hypothetical protein